MGFNSEYNKGYHTGVATSLGSLAGSLRREYDDKARRDALVVHAPDSGQHCPQATTSWLEWGKGFGLIGAIGYSFVGWGQHLAWPQIAGYAVTGAIAGAIAGVALYLAILVVKFILKIALWSLGIGLVGVALYSLMR